MSSRIPSLALLTLVVPAVACGADGVARVEVVDMSPIPIAASGEWPDVPEYLQGATIHAKRAAKPRGNKNELDCTVNEPGVLVLLASWDYDGNASGGWLETSTSQSQLEEDGWVFLENVTRRVRDGRQRHALFRRAVRPGERFHFHTRKHNPPFVVEVSAERLPALVAVRAPERSVHDDAVFARASRDGRTRDFDVVMLELRSGGLTQRHVREGAVFRELVRQSLLLAARDELGLATRDRGLRETFPSDEEGDNVPLHVAVTPTPNGNVDVSIRRRGPEGWERLFERGLSLQPDDMTASGAKQLEKLSRGGFVELLESAGFESIPHTPVPDDGEVAPEIAERLGVLDFAAQYSCLRSLHRAIREHGESETRLSALARCYANLGMLTELRWSPAHVVFEARALLYAERLVQRTRGDVLSSWTRGYVRGVLTYQRLAVQDFERASSLTEDSEEPPRWVEPVRAVCFWERDRLAELEEDEDPTIRSLTHLLQLRFIEWYNREPITLRHATAVLNDVPSCLRANDTLVRRGGLGVRRTVAASGPPFFEETIYDRLGDLLDLPQPVLDAFEVENEEGEFDRRLAVIGALRDAGTATADRHEPSLDLLAQLLAEVGFSHAIDDCQICAYLGIDAADVVERWTPVVAGHPFEDLPKACVSDRIAAGFAAKRLLRDVRPTELEGWDTLLMWKMYGVDRAEFARRFPSWTANQSNEDLRGMLFWLSRERNENARRSRAATILRNAPYSPAGVSATISYDWETAESRIEDWERRYGDDPIVLDALGLQYLNQGRLDEALRCFERQLDLVGDLRSVSVLASVYEKTGDHERYRKMLAKGLEFPSTGLDHARLQYRIARSYVREGRWDDASPWAEQASHSGASWAVQFHAACCEAVGKYEEAEQAFRFVARRYGSTQPWFYFCHRTGKGEEPEAREAHQRNLDDKTKPLTQNRLLDGATFSLLTDQPDECVQLLETDFNRQVSYYTGLQLALVVDAMGKTSRRDEVLDTLCERGPSARRPAKQRSPYHHLAERFRDELAEGKRSGLTVEEVDELVRNAESGVATNSYYFAGAYLLSHGDRKQALACLERAATSPQYQRLTTTLSAALLRAEGETVGRRRGVEVPPREPTSADE